MVGEKIKNFRGQAYLIWATGTLFFFYQYFVRVIPSILEYHLEVTFQATTAQVASAIGLYLIVYAAMQLVVGPLFDTYGCKKLFLYACAILTLSCLLPLIPCKSLFLFGFARIWMGATSAFAFVGALYLCMFWFPPQQLALFSGLTAGIGILGAITAQISLSYLANKGCNIWLITFGFGLLVTLALYLFIPGESPGEKQHTGKNSWRKCGQNLLAIGKKWQTWNIGLIATVAYIPSAVFADLWCIPYLTNVGHFSLIEASQLASILNLTRAVSAPTIGWISDKKQARKAPLVISGFSLALCFLFLLSSHHLSFWAMAYLFMLMGFFSGGEIIGFVTCAEQNSPDAHASAIAFINMIIMGFCGILQSLTGHIIQYCGFIVPTASAFRCGLGFLALFSLITTLLFSALFKTSKTCHSR